MTIRGVGFNDFTSIQNPGVGVYVDQVIVPFHSMMSFQLLDLERIEVLKGPQGTLYGRNTTAGAINFVSVKPSQELSGKLRLDYSSWDTKDLELAIGGGLTDNISARLAFSKYKRDDSFQVNRTHPEDNIGEKDRTAYRLSLNWQSPQFDALLNIHGGKDKSGQVAMEHLASIDAITGTEPCAPVAAGKRAEGPCVNVLGYFDADNDPHAGDFSVVNGGVDNEAFGFGLTLNWQLSDALNITSVTGYDTFDRYQLLDADASPFVFIDITFTDETKVFSQELRLNYQGKTFSWVSGIFYSDDTVEALQSANVTELFGGDPLTELIKTDIVNHQDSTSLALFSHVDMRLTETLTLLVGLRYTDETKKWNGGTSFPVLSINNFSQLNLEDTDVSGQIGLEYRPDHDWLVYGTYSKGFRSGGFPGGFASDPEQLQAFDAEQVFAYEIGFKATLANGAVQLDVAAYLYDWQDIQSQLTEQRTQRLWTGSP